MVAGFDVVYKILEFEILPGWTLYHDIYISQLFSKYNLNFDEPDKYT